jgi:medium-chain acyl-[acyl-carrier-protein] hydrolase
MVVKISTYFDIDLNHHVTSTRYVDWMMDSIPVDFLSKHYPSAISINYMKETQLGDSILLHSAKPHSTLSCFEGFNKTKGVVSFRGKIEFSTF